MLTLLGHFPGNIDTAHNQTLPVIDTIVSIQNFIYVTEKFLQDSKSELIIYDAKLTRNEFQYTIAFETNENVHTS